MRKKVILGLVAFYVIPFLILFLNPNTLKTYLDSVYNADLLYPFSIYQGMFHTASRPDWVFGGYTPFFELIVGLLFWIISRNIQTTVLLYAFYQPVLLTLSILYVANSIVGKNLKVFSLVVIFSAIPIYLYSSGLFPSGWFLFSWYTHVTTVWMGWLALGLIIQFLAGPPQITRSSLKPLLLIALLILFAVLSDALFISQFTIPIIAAIILFLLLKRLPFRKGAYLGLVILYATAGGLAAYRLPTIWGSERLAFYGSYFKPTLEQVLNNLKLVVEIIPTAWGSSLMISGLWILFYALCLVKVVPDILYFKREMGHVQKRLLIFFTFLLAQMGANIGSGLTTITEPGVRYFLPVVFVPLFWGWPFLLAAAPGWMKWLRGARLIAVEAALAACAVLLLFTNTLSIQNLVASANQAPEFVECIDRKTSERNLHRGMANYWQARPVTLFSKTGLVVVQVDPDLVPFRILNNTDGYRDDFDFVIISNDFRPGRWMDKNVVLEKFGQPASTFFCQESEILVYNRSEDTLVKNHFDQYFPPD